MDSTTDSSSATLMAIAASVLSIALIYYHIKVFTFWRRQGVKGPTPWPIFGTNIYYVFEPKVIVDAKWTKKYGRVYGIYEGYEPTLRITDAELIKHVFIKDFQSFTDRNNKAIFGDNMTRWLLWSEGAHWSNQRALITPMMTSAKLRSMVATMSSCAQRFIDEVKSRTARAITKGGEEGHQVEREKKLAEGSKNIYTKDELMAITLDVIATTFMSIKINTYQDKSSEFSKRAFAFASFDMVWFVIWLFIPTFVARRFKIDPIRLSKYEYFDKLSKKIIAERRKNPKSRKNDLIQALIDAKLPENYNESIYNADDEADAYYNSQMTNKELDEVQKQQVKDAKFRHLDDLEICAHMTFFFLAGFETTSSTTSFCLYELAHRQEDQERVYQELLTMPKLRDPVEYNDLQSLKLLDAFVSETLRLYSPTTDHNRLVVVKKGVHLPTEPPIYLPYRTSVSVSGFELQRDAGYWPEPLKFDMSRFYPENRAKIRPGTYTPFGAGPRNCLGMRFALLNIKSFLATVLLRYRVLPGPKAAKYPPDFKPHAFFLQLVHTDFRLIPREIPLED